MSYCTALRESLYHFGECLHAYLGLTLQYLSNFFWLPRLKPLITAVVQSPI